MLERRNRTHFVVQFHRIIGFPLFRQLRAAFSRKSALVQGNWLAVGYLRLYQRISIDALSFCLRLCAIFNITHHRGSGQRGLREFAVWAKLPRHTVAVFDVCVLPLRYRSGELFPGL